MSDNALFPVPESVAKSALIDDAKYQAMYKQSLDDPEGFWAEQGKRIHWIKPYTKIKDVSYEGDVQIRWFYDGKLNASANCLDRHLSSRGDQVAIIWEGDDPADSKEITYAELHREVCKFANVLKAQGVKKGDRVTVYLPMIPRDRRGGAGLRADWRGSFRGVRRIFRPTRSPGAFRTATRP